MDRRGRSYYEVLGVPRTASYEEIRRAYSRLLRQHHPDHNPDDPEAVERTALINRAWEVLRDPQRRAAYDRFLRNSEVVIPAPPPPIAARQGDDLHLRCQRCLVQDDSLRITYFLQTISYILVTVKRAKGGLLCARCRQAEARSANLMTFFFGWWGFPWGLLYSIESLCTNLSGGIRPPDLNARFLAGLGMEFYRKGDINTALGLLEESYRYQPNPAVETLRRELSQWAVGSAGRQPTSS